MAAVDRVTDALADEVIGYRPAAQAVFGEQVVARLAVGGVAEGLADIEMVAPAGELEAIVAPFADAPGEFVEREIGPLAGEEGERAGHGGLRGYVGVGWGDYSVEGVDYNVVFVLDSGKSWSDNWRCFRISLRGSPLLDIKGARRSWQIGSGIKSPSWNSRPAWMLLAAAAR